MQWHNFAMFATFNLQLGSCLDWHIGPMALSGGGSHPEFTRRSWVEQQVQYVVVRPFESLDMDASDTKANGTNVVYVVWFHIDGEERPCSRLRYLDSDGPGTTVQQLIDGLVTWHSEYWALQPNRPLIIDTVVRHSTTREPGTSYYRESVEFFLVPDIAQPQT